MGYRRNRKKSSGIGIFILFLFLFLGIGAAGYFGSIMFGITEDPFQKQQETEVWDSAKEGYYYSFLNEAEQQVYRTLLSSCESFEFEIPLRTPVSEDEVFHAVTAVSFDYPKYYWINSTYTYYRNNKDLVTSVKFESDGTEESSLQRIDVITSEVLKDLPEDTYDAYRYLYEYIIDTTDYDAAAAVSGQNITSVFFDHRSVCAGYSKAFQYLCQKAGLYCTYVTGTAVMRDGATGNHAWNMVRINDRYYWVDVTWGDPMFEGYETPSLNYNYFCVSDRFLFAEHQIDNTISSESTMTELPVSYPPCDDDSMDWYVRNGLYFETYDPNSVYPVIRQVVQEESERIELKFGSLDELMNAVSDLIYSENIFTVIYETGKNCTSLSYVTYDEIGVIWIIPEYVMQ